MARLFGDRTPEVFLRGFDRPNIHLAFAVKDGPRRQILEFAAARRGQSGIVYTATRAKTETLAQALNEAGHSAVAYHAGLEADQRREVDARPSDAIAIALRADADVLVSAAVLERAVVSEASEEEAVRAVLEQLRPEDLGEYEM